MTPQQKIKYLIVARVSEWEKKDVPVFDACDIDALYQGLVDSDSHYDAENEIRASGIDTGLPCDWSRCYESKSVAAELPDGSWVGWTYWYGGGKHGEPESIDWMDEAYDVACKAEEKLVTVRSFSKPVTETAEVSN